MPTAPSSVPQEVIAQRAYELWQARGCPSGDGTADWEAAVAELTAQSQSGASALRAWLNRVRRSITGRNN